MRRNPHERRKHDRVKDQPRGPSNNSVRAARKVKVRDQRLRSREPGESPIDHYRPKVEIGGEVSPFGQALIDAVAAEPKSHQPEDHAK